MCFSTIPTLTVYKTMWPGTSRYMGGSGLLRCRGLLYVKLLVALMQKFFYFAIELFGLVVLSVKV